MAAASYDTIGRWFDKGVEQRAKYLIIVHDTYDKSNYPVFCDDDEECWKEYEKHNGKNMQEIEEVYDLSFSRSIQMCELRAMRLPKKV